jgi:hypothetical protein
MLAALILYILLAWIAIEDIYFGGFKKAKFKDHFSVLGIITLGVLLTILVFNY